MHCSCLVIHSVDLRQHVLPQGLLGLGAKCEVNIGTIDIKAESSSTLHNGGYRLI